MAASWTPTQRQRLKELNAEPQLLELVFSDARERDREFQKIERRLVEQHRKRLEELKAERRQPQICILERRIVDRLTAAGFVQVLTPILLSKGMLKRMTIGEDHPLFKQVFWVDDDKCLRPMLAPNLYHMMRHLLRIWGKPLRIFEIGPCFRKESQGAMHLNEFTMLNLVEVDDFEGRQLSRLEELAALVMDAAGIRSYRLERSESEVYGETVDVLAGDLELGSGAYGPHRLDLEWGITDPWVGIGFGMERLTVALEGHTNIHRAGRSLSYLDGARLNI
ncbi:MAG: pyrrolysine--tRNA(Pyl) ligase large subunit [Thermacetogeniaceae bacterium]